MKKLINNPDDVVRESLQGMATAHPDLIKVHFDPHFIYSADAPIPGKVALISGGGTGHEPMHGGFVGLGMLDAACPGEVFTSPTPDQMLEAAKVVNGGAGVLNIVKNYSGDVMNFEMAAELAHSEGIKVLNILIDDDIAVKDSLYTQGRRGVGTTILAEKICGAAAQQGYDLKQLAELCHKVNLNGRSMGMALTSCTVPAKGSPTFELGDDEIEVGIGIHGEPGRQRMSLKSADEITEMLAISIIEDSAYTRTVREWDADKGEWEDVRIPGAAAALPEARRPRDHRVLRIRPGQAARAGEGRVRGAPRGQEEGGREAAQIPAAEARPARGDDAPLDLLRGGGRALFDDHALGEVARPGAPLRDLLRRRPRHHGGGQPRGDRARRRPDRRPRHQPAHRGEPEPVHHPRAPVRVPLLLHAQALVRLSRLRPRRLPRRLRHHGRALRGPHPGADPQDRPPAADHSLRQQILEGLPQFRRPGPLGHHQPARPQAVQDGRQPQGSLRVPQEGAPALVPESAAVDLPGAVRAEASPAPGGVSGGCRPRS